MTAKFENITHKFTNGVTVVNTTPHPLTFMSPEGEVVTVPTSVPAGEKTGFAVVNARAVTKEVAPHLVKTVFVPSPEGEAIIEAIRKEVGTMAENVMIVGSLAAANAFKEVVGMVPAPGFERVPPAEKRMSCEQFNVGEAF